VNRTSTLASLLCCAALGLGAAGCSGSSSGGGGATASTAAASSSSNTAPSSNTTPAPAAPAPVTSLSDVHGTLVSVPGSVGDTLALLIDGESEPLELSDPSALVAAGAGPGASVTLSGSRGANAAGTSSLSERALVASFVLDEIARTGALEAGANGGVVFRDRAGRTYELLGPLSAAALSHPLGAPLRLTGAIDANHVSTLTAGPGLEVSSFRAAQVLTLRIQGGSSGLDERFTIEDLTSGAAAYFKSEVTQPGADRRGHGTLSFPLAQDLASKLSAAALRSQPDRFAPPAGTAFPGGTLTTLTLEDDLGTKQVEVLFQAQPPAEVQELLDALFARKDSLPTYRELALGSQSQVTGAETRVARDDAELAALWAAHGGAGAPPSVDFQTEIVVALFMGSQPTGGYGISIERLEQRGAALDLSVLRSSPAPGAIVTQALTAPFQFVAVERKTTQQLRVDGKVIP